MNTDAAHRSPAILALDSGIGGLTIVAEIRRILPGLAIHYLADSAGFPYGGMASERLVDRLVALVDEAIERLRPTAVVVACNTASTIALATLRQRFDLPFVGVVPPIKTAGQRSISRCIGLLATSATASGPYVDKLVADHAADCRVIRVACPGLAELAEAKARGAKVDRGALKRILAPLMGPDAARMDTVILGCTHYPILLDEMREVLPGPVHWLDSAPAVAARVKTVLGADGAALGMGPTGRATGEFWVTGPLAATDGLGPFLRLHGFDQVGAWRVGPATSRPAPVPSRP